MAALLRTQWPACVARTQWPACVARTQWPAWLRAFLGTLIVLGAAGCGSTSSDKPEGAGGGPMRIVTTVAPLTSIVASVAGDRAVVRGLVPEGTNSHTFEPPPSAAKAIAQADVVFLNGLKLEDPTRELAEENLSARAEIVQLGDLALPPSEQIYDFSFPRSGGKPNPHLWTDPPLAKRYARLVADTLLRRDPVNATAYDANYAAFAEQVDALHEALVAASSTLPPDRRKLLTYHDAYAYFARDYGWTVIGAIQPSSFDDPTPREVADLMTQIRKEGVPAIFGSEVFPSPVLEQIGRETGVRYVDVLRDDDLPGGPGDPEHSWLGLMRLNFITMVENLGGDAAALKAVGLGRATGALAAEYPQ